jgi:hypothetical protein
MRSEYRFKIFLRDCDFEPMIIVDGIINDFSPRARFILKIKSNLENDFFSAALDVSFELV